MLAFDRERYKVLEGDSVSIGIVRMGDNSKVQQVILATSSRSANEQDYQLAQQIVIFQSGEVYKYVDILTLEDDNVEPEEVFTVQLLAMEANSLAAPNVATVTIVDATKNNP